MAQKAQRVNDAIGKLPKNKVLERMTTPPKKPVVPSKTTHSGSKGKVPTKDAIGTVGSVKKKKGSATGGKYSYAPDLRKPLQDISAKREAEIKRKASKGIALVKPDEHAMSLYNQFRKVNKPSKSRPTTSK